MSFDFDTSPNQNEGNNEEFQNGETQPKTTSLDDMLNMNFQPLNEQPQENNNAMLNMDFNMDKNINTNINPIDEEEQKRIADRKKEADERKEKINQKIKKEEELRKEIMKKAAEYMVEFEQKRQEYILKRRKELEEKNSDLNKNNEKGNNADSWGRVNSNIDLKDSEYKGSKDVQRMREAMINRTKDPNSEPLQKFFG